LLLPLLPETEQVKKLPVPVSLLLLLKLIPASVGRDEFSNLLIDPTTNRNLLEGQSSTDNMQKAMALGKFIINMIKSQPKPNPKPDPK